MHTLNINQSAHVDTVLSGKYWEIGCLKDDAVSFYGLLSCIFKMWFSLSVWLSRHRLVIGSLSCKKMQAASSYLNEAKMCLAAGPRVPLDDLF